MAAGTSLLVTGGGFDGTEELALRLLRGEADEGVILVSTDEPGERVVEEYESAAGYVNRSRVGVVDCVGEEADLSPARVFTVSGPNDLTGIGMRFSKLYQELANDGVRRVRTGVHSVSTLFAYAEQRAVCRFVHTVTGRIGSVGGLGVFVADPGVVDDRLLSTVGNFCDGRLEVRDDGDGPAFRIRGLRDQPDGWHSL